MRSGHPLLTTVVVCIYFYMLLPLFVVVLFSFSDRSFFVFPPTGFSLQWYERAWSSGGFVQPAIRSIALALLATFIAGILAVPASLGLRRMSRSRLAQVLEFVILSPLIVPALIIGIALLHFYISFGLIDTFSGLLLAHVILVLPFMFRSVVVSIHDLNPAHLEASEMLGAPPLTTFRRVVLPTLVPGIVAGGVFAFIVSLDHFTISLFITQSKQTTLPVAIYKYLYDVNDPVVAAVSTALVMFGLVLALLMQRAGWLKHLSHSGG
jgi:putative spermidine/putrescine transport system permease protein